MALYLVWKNDILYLSLRLRSTHGYKPSRVASITVTIPRRHRADTKKECGYNHHIIDTPHKMGIFWFSTQRKQTSSHQGGFYFVPSRGSILISNIRNMPVKRKTPQRSSRKNKGGRPPVMTPDTLAKLETAFSMWLPDEQACLYAEIDPSTLYRYQEKNPKFWERKALLKQNVTMHARMNVAERVILWSAEDSWKWLERRERAEFSTRQEVTGADGASIQTVSINILWMKKPDEPSS